MNKTTQKTYPHIVLLVMVVFFAISFITNILNSIISDVKESYELSLTQTGFLPFSFFIAYGVMSVPAGFLAERYSDKRLLGAAFALIAGASLVFTLLPQYGIFTVTLFTLGCSMAVLQVIINPMLRAAGGAEHFAFNSVLGQLVFGLASFASPYLYIYLVSDTPWGLAEVLRAWVPESLPWVSLYLVFALMAIFLFLIVRLTTYPNLEKQADERAGSKASYLDLLKNKWTWLYFAGIFCYVGTEQGIGNWLAQYLQSAHGMDPQTTGATTVAYFWAMLTAGCILGLLALKIWDSRKVLIVASLATIGCLLAALYGSGETALYAFPACGFTISVMWSIIFSLGLNSVAHHHGSLSGILCTGIAGGAIMPLFVGMIADILGLQMGMLFLLIPLCFIGSIGFWARPLITNQTLKKKKS